MIISDIVLGALLLLLGRQVFWLGIGILGFLVGVDFASAMGSQSSAGMAIIFALFFGILGAAFAVTFQWVAIVLMGFFGGGYFLMNIFSFMAGETQYIWGLFVVGGIIGMLVMVIAFDWALIGISSLIGALLIVRNLNVDESLRSLLFLGMIIFGALVQYLSLEASPKSKEQSEREKSDS